MGTKAIFESHPVGNLKKAISKTNIKGYSKMKKGELVALMVKNRERFKDLEFYKPPPKTVYPKSPPVKKTIKVKKAPAPAKKAPVTPKPATPKKSSSGKVGVVDLKKLTNSQKGAEYLASLYTPEVVNLAGGKTTVKIKDPIKVLKKRGREWIFEKKEGAGNIDPEGKPARIVGEEYEVDIPRLKKELERKREGDVFTGSMINNVGDMLNRLPKLDTEKTKKYLVSKDPQLVGKPAKGNGGVFLDVGNFRVFPNGLGLPPQVISFDPKTEHPNAPLSIYKTFFG